MAGPVGVVGADDEVEGVGNAEGARDLEFGALVPEGADGAVDGRKAVVVDDAPGLQNATSFALRSDAGSAPDRDAVAAIALGVIERLIGLCSKLSMSSEPGSRLATPKLALTWMGGWLPGNFSERKRRRSLSATSAARV